jgi:hypothetical protein
VKPSCPARALALPLPEIGHRQRQGQGQEPADASYFADG